MKVLLILEHFHPYIGGAEKLFKSIADGYVAAGWEVVVLTTRFDKGLSRVEERNGLTIHRIDCKNRFRFSFQAIPKALELSKDCDVIQSSTYNALTVAKVCAFIRKKPILITVHEIWGKAWFSMPYLSGIQKLLYFSFERFVLSLGYDRYIAISKSTKQQLEAFGIPDKKVELIYNGFEDNSGKRWSKREGQKPVFFGRLGVSKGIDLIIEAAGILKARGVDFKMNMVLPRKPKSLLRQILHHMDSKGVSNSFELLHELSWKELQELLCDSSYAIIPSRAEGFGFAALEAAHLGLPIIHSGVGGLQETTGGECIELNALRAESLADAIIQAEEGKWIQTSVPQFDLNQMVDSYQKCLKELAGHG